MKPNDAAIRKRTQINSANRTMFLWIAVASALIGVGLVVSIFLFQTLVYNEKVLAEKLNTVSVLDHNNNTVPELENQIRVLDTNTALASIKANDDDQALQVILDALPAEANSLALGSSLQNKLLVGIDGLVIESIQVTQVAAAGAADTVVDASADTGAINEIPFQISVRGSQNAKKKVLDNLERSIRTMVVTSVRIEASDMIIQGKAFYEPTKSIELQDKVVKR